MCITWSRHRTFNRISLYMMAACKSILMLKRNGELALRIYIAYVQLDVLITLPRQNSGQYFKHCGKISPEGRISGNNTVPLCRKKLRHLWSPSIAVWCWNWQRAVDPSTSSNVPIKLKHGVGKTKGVLSDLSDLRDFQFEKFSNVNLDVSY